MKLVKLSLATVVAAGSFSFANAVALDEAIQNVDLSGYLRYRYDSTAWKVDGKTVNRDRQNHQLRGHLKFTADVADNFKATAVMRYDSKDYSYGSEANADVNSTFKVREGYLTYNNFDTSVNLGRMEVKSIWTDGLVGNGITVLNNSVEGLTLGAYVFDNFNKYEGDLIGDNIKALAYEDGSLSKGALPNGGLFAKQNNIDINASIEKSANISADLTIANDPRLAPFVGTSQLATYREMLKNHIAQTMKKDSDAMNKIRTGVVAQNLDRINSMIYNHNLYGIVAMGSYAPLDFGLWVSYLNKIGTFYALDLGANFGDKDSVAYNIHAQYAGNSLKNDVKDLVGLANGNFYGVEAGLNAYGFDANLGYVGFGKKDKWTINTLHDKGQLINSGEIVMDRLMTASLGKSDFIFTELGYTYADVRMGVDVVYGVNKVHDSLFNTNVKDKLFEVTPRLSYKYSDKLEFSSYYAISKVKRTFAEFPKYDYSTRTNKIRLEAKYTF